MSKLSQASQAVSGADPAPALGPPLVPPPDWIRHPVVALAAALPGCFIYLFCTNRVAADSFWFKKREEEGKKKKSKENASWLFSLPWSWQRDCSSGGGSNSSLASRLMQQAARQWGVGTQTHREGGEAKVQLGWDRPQPWRDAAPNLMPPPSFSGKCPCPSVGKSQLPFPMALSKTRPC